MHGHTNDAHAFTIQAGGVLRYFRCWWCDDPIPTQRKPEIADHAGCFFHARCFPAFVNAQGFTRDASPVLARRFQLGYMGRRFDVHCYRKPGEDGAIDPRDLERLIQRTAAEAEGGDVDEIPT